MDEPDVVQRDSECIQEELTQVPIKSPHVDMTSISLSDDARAQDRSPENTDSADAAEESNCGSELGVALTWDRMQCTVKQISLYPNEQFYRLKGVRRKDDADSRNQIVVYPLTDEETWESEERTVYVVGVAAPGIAYVLRHCFESMLQGEVAETVTEQVTSLFIAMYIKTCIYGLDYEEEMRELAGPPDFRPNVRWLFSEANRFAAAHTAEQCNHGEVDWDAQYAFLISDRPSLSDGDAEFLAVVHTSQHELMMRTDAIPFLPVKGKNLLRCVCNVGVAKGICAGEEA